MASDAVLEVAEVTATPKVAIANIGGAGMKDKKCCSALGYANLCDDGKRNFRIQSERNESGFSLWKSLT
jgi:hypothetical protein